jgi:hypothetical protein
MLITKSKNFSKKNSKKCSKINNNGKNTISLQSKRIKKRKINLGSKFRKKETKRESLQISNSKKEWMKKRDT